MEAVVPILHGRQAWASEQLDVAKCSIEVEVSCTRSKCVACQVAQRHPDLVSAVVDEVRDVEEERIVAAPVGSDFHIVNVDVGALVGMLEPEVSRLRLLERNGRLEVECAFGIA